MAEKTVNARRSPRTGLEVVPRVEEGSMTAERLEIARLRAEVAQLKVELEVARHSARCFAQITQGVVRRLGK